MTPRPPLFDNRVGFDCAGHSPLVAATGALYGKAPGTDVYRVPTRLFVDHDDFPDPLRGTKVGRRITCLATGADATRLRFWVWSFLYDAGSIGEEDA